MRPFRRDTRNLDAPYVVFFLDRHQMPAGALVATPSAANLWRDGLQPPIV